MSMFGCKTCLATIIIHRANTQSFPNPHPTSRTDQQPEQLPTSCREEVFRRFFRHFCSRTPRSREKWAQKGMGGGGAKLTKIKNSQQFNHSGEESEHRSPRTFNAFGFRESHLVGQSSLLNDTAFGFYFQALIFPARYSFSKCPKKIYTFFGGRV